MRKRKPSASKHASAIGTAPLLPTSTRVTNDMVTIATKSKLWQVYATELATPFTPPGMQQHVVYHEEVQQLLYVACHIAELTNGPFATITRHFHAENAENQ